MQDRRSSGDIHGYAGGSRQTAAGSPPICDLQVGAAVRSSLRELLAIPHYPHSMRVIRDMSPNMRPTRDAMASPLAYCIVLAITIELGVVYVFYILYASHLANRHSKPRPLLRAPWLTLTHPSRRSVLPHLDPGVPHPAPDRPPRDPDDPPVRRARLLPVRRRRLGDALPGLGRVHRPLPLPLPLPLARL